MRFKPSTLSCVISGILLAFSQSAVSEEVHGDISKFSVDKKSGEIKKSSNSGLFIVQMKGKTSIAKAIELGELLPKNQLVSNQGNRYNAQSAKMQAYNAKLIAKQQLVAVSSGDIKINYYYQHTFNGFSAYLTPQQKLALESDPNVIGVWADELQQLTTANTPAFLGLTGAGGQHDLGIYGEDVVIGVVDTGIWPEHPSFAGEDYAPLAGWTGTCDVGEDEEFACNNKLIGARYFKESFESTYVIQTALGEFISPRDADGHGSHTASTAGGNDNVAAQVGGRDAGMVSGMAPRARIAAYKACWNSSYVSPEGNKERGCFYGDTMAAIDQAVADGVDVINYSIGGSLTNLLTPSAAAMLWAAEAGVFVSVSAGNSGPTAGTIGTPAPWVTSVAASTYSGVLPAAGVEQTIDGVSSVVAAVEGAINKKISDIGPISEDLVVAMPLEACFDGDDATALDNAGELSGKIALISRGTCGFVNKLERAMLSGAKGVVVFNNRAGAPIAMGGEGDFNLGAFMIDQTDGEALKQALEDGSAVSVRLDASLSSTIATGGNVMASFSSRGPNKSSDDILKPDITAPGVKILAATTAAPMFGDQGNSFAYLQGTSMSSPHIAGMAALFKESNPNWSPAQIKSALMTSARQNITTDGTIAATPLDFGAGHAAPKAAMDPGLLLDVGINDYLGFLCGLGETSFVEDREVSCADLATAGHSPVATELNIASIAMGNFTDPRVVNRYVTNATATASSYAVNVDAPAGIDVVVSTFDSEGNLTPSDNLDVDGSGSAGFALSFSQNDDAVLSEWTFGAVTWSDSTGHTVRLPIAIKPEAITLIDAPEMISTELKRGRVSFPIKMKYSGATSLDYVGFLAPSGIEGKVLKDEDKSFSFNEDGLGTHMFHVPEGTKVARFSLTDGLVNAAGSDLDLYVYHCDKWSCSRVGQSFNAGSNEDVILVNPKPAADIGVGDVYIVWVHAFTVGDDQADTDYVMPAWIVDQADQSTRISSSRRARDGRYNNISIRTKGLTSGLLHMGAVTFYDDKGDAQQTTVLEVVPD